MRTSEILEQRKLEHKRNSSRPARRANGRSFKHSRRFKYSRNTMAFPDLQTLGRFKTGLEQQGITQIVLKSLNKLPRINWYTREDLGAK